MDDEKRKKQAAKRYRKLMSSIFGNEGVDAAASMRLPPKAIKYNKAEHGFRDVLGNVIAGAGLLAALSTIAVVFFSASIPAIIGTALAAQITPGVLATMGLGSLGAFFVAHFIERGPEGMNREKLDRVWDVEKSVAKARQNIIDLVNQDSEQAEKYMGKLVLFEDDDLARIQNQTVRTRIKEMTLRVTGQYTEDMQQQLETMRRAGNMGGADSLLDKAFGGRSRGYYDDYHYYYGPRFYVFPSSHYHGGSYGGGGGDFSWASDIFKNLGSGGSGGGNSKGAGQAILVLIAVAAAITAIVGNTYRLLKPAAPFVEGIDYEAFLPDASADLRKLRLTLRTSTENPGAKLGLRGGRRKLTRLQQPEESAAAAQPEEAKPRLRHVGVGSGSQPTP